MCWGKPDSFSMHGAIGTRTLRFPRHHIQLINDSKIITLEILIIPHSIPHRQFGPPSDLPELPEPVAAVEEPKREKPAKRAKQKNDPKYVAAARELRDRYLEKLESGDWLPVAGGKYEVTRQLETSVEGIKTVPLLAA